MTIQTIWNALPKAVDAAYYYFSVFVSHRLTGVPAPSTLANYPIGTPGRPHNWALAMESLLLEVSFDGGATFHPAERIPLGQPQFWAAPDPALWHEVFPDSTVVDPFVPQSPFARNLRSFRAVALAREYEQVYSAVAQSNATDYPAVSDPAVTGLVQTLGTFRAFIPDLRRVFPPRGDGPPANVTRIYLAWLAQNIGGPFVALGPAAQDIAIKHWEAFRFYRRSLDSQYGPLDPTKVKPVDVPQPEFHKLVGMLADHPTLLRNLGFVMDFRVPRNVPAAAEGLLQVHPQWRAAAPVDRQTPQTLYRIDANGFFAREMPGPTDLRDGMLVMRSYDVVQVDVDGHSQKMMGYGISARTALLTKPGGPAAPDPKESLPARRGGGLTVMKDDRLATSVIPQLQRVDALNATLAAGDPTHPVQLDVSDVTRGYRVDVWDGSGTWKSLCRRQGHDVVGGATTVPFAAPDVEGFVKDLGGTRGAPDADPGEQNTLYIHEALFGWDGWSMCAPRPGRGIGQLDGDANQVPVLGFLANHAPPGYTVTSSVRATPRSLPRLRYGQTYQLRARLVDLAGNGLPFTHEAGIVDPEFSTAPATFLRYEPLDAPALVLRRDVNLGESLETIVIRSNPAPVADISMIVPGNNASSYASGDPDAIKAGFLPLCERHLVPPKTSQIMAETHGMLDALTPIEALRVSSKEAGTLTLDTVFNVDTGVEESLPPGELQFVGGPPPTPGGAMQQGQLALHTLDSVTVPYLPDPLARGLTLQFPAPSPQVVPPLDPSLPTVFRRPWVFDPKGWPRIHSIRLVVEESPTANVTASATPSTLTIGLPPATLLPVRYSSLPNAAQIQKHAVFQEVRGTPAEAAALEGTHWMLSPYRALLLVHAVQRPLVIPSFRPGLSLTRDVGWTYVLVRGQIQLDGRSTVHVDVNAAWFDPFDGASDPTGPHPKDPQDPTALGAPKVDDPKTDHTGRAFQVPVQYFETSVLTFAGGAAGNGQPLRHEFGDTKHRWVTYSPDGTTRYREYFPPSVTEHAENITKGVPELLNVLSSKRPDHLRVLYAVPTFKWVKSGTTQTRVGRGIRIYMDRPWFVSGVDEMVAVLLLPPAGRGVIGGGTDPALAKYTSEWGRDPAWTSTSVPEPLQPEHFTNRALVTPEPVGFSPSPTPLSSGPFALAEDNTRSASVVAFFPEFNAERNLWFVDIEMDPGPAYFPFVRLALARFQPHSIHPGSPQSQHLSRVTRTEFLQLVPDRTASISFDPGGLLGVTVTGVGAFNALATTPGAPPNSQNVAFGHNVLAQVQHRPKGSNNDLLWTTLGREATLGTLAIDPPDLVTWFGRVPLPANPDSTQEYRLLVRETESYVADAEVAEEFIVNTPLATRLVYACGIPLNL